MALALLGQGHAAGRRPLVLLAPTLYVPKLAYPWLVRATAMVNSFYFYCFDKDFGPFFIKFCSYFPYTAKARINGHHWSQ